MKRSIINTVSWIIITISVLIIGMTTVLAWKPFREQGSKISLSGTTSKIEASEAWNGTFSNFLLCGIDKTNMLTDVIMVVSLNNASGKISILQIPRDTYAGSDIPSNKYNAVYGHHPKDASGMETLKAHIQRDFGITINHYAAITTKGFDLLVDSVGGVNLNVPVNMNYDDSTQDLHIHLKKGMQHLNGSQAEQFVRYRKGWSEGDIGRLQAQKEFLAVFAAKLKQQNIIQLATKVLPSLFPPNFISDMSINDMVPYGLAAKKIDMKNINIYTAPGEPYTSSKNSLSLYSVHRDELLKIINENFMPQGESITQDDMAIKELTKTSSGSSYTQNGNLQDIYNSGCSIPSVTKK